MVVACRRRSVIDPSRLWQGCARVVATEGVLAAWLIRNSTGAPTNIPYLRHGGKPPLRNTLSRSSTEMPRTGAQYLQQVLGRRRAPVNALCWWRL